MPSLKRCVQPLPIFTGIDDNAASVPQVACARWLWIHEERTRLTTNHQPYRSLMQTESEILCG
jgi:hypothetical protein